MPTLELAIDSRKALQGAADFNRAINSMNRNVRVGTTGIGTGFSRMTGTLRNAIQRSIRSMQSFVRSIFSLRTAFLTLGVGVLVRQLIRYADTWQNAENRIRPFAGTLQKTVVLQEELFRLSQKTRQEFGETTNLFSRMFVNREAIGATTMDILRFTENVQKSLALSGSTSSEAAGALRQLSQLVANPVVRGAGQEIAAIREQAPRLFVAILEGLDMSEGEFRRLAAIGGITSKEIIDALDKVGDKLEEEFSQITPTIGQAFQVLDNSITRTIGLLSKSSGFGRAFTDFIMELSRAVDNLGNVLSRGDTFIELVRLRVGERVKRFDSEGNLKEFTEENSEVFGGQAAQIFMRVLMIELEQTFMPAIINIIANLPLLLTAKGLQALQTIVPVMFDIVIKLAMAFGDALIDAISERLQFKIFLPSSAEGEGVGDLASSIGSGIQSIIESLDKVAMENISQSSDEVADGFLRIRDALHVLSMIVTEGSDDLTLLQEQMGTLAIDALSTAEGVRAMNSVLDSFRENMRQILDLGTGKDTSAVFDMIDNLRTAGFGGSIRFDSFNPELQAFMQEQSRLKALGFDVNDQVGLNEEGIRLLDLYKEQMNEIIDAERAEQFAEAISGTLVDGFAAAITQARELEDILRSIGTSIIRTIFNAVAGRGLNQAITSGFEGLFAPQANGNAFSGGRVVPFASGGVVDGPTMFPMSSGRRGLMGEAGPEAIMPLQRGPDGKLGVQASGSQSVSVTMNIRTPDADSFRRSQRQITRSIQRAIRQEV